MGKYTKFVNDYLNRLDTFQKAPLVFCKISRSKDVFATELIYTQYPDAVQVKYREDLDELVEEICKLSDYFGSMNATTGVYETSINRIRSALDIWRHVIFYRPEITLHEVMRNIYNNREKYVGQFCNTVDRRVFKLKSQHPRWEFFSRHEVDEFNLSFYDWEHV